MSSSHSTASPPEDNDDRVVMDESPDSPWSPVDSVAPLGDSEGRRRLIIQSSASSFRSRLAFLWTCFCWCWSCSFRPSPLNIPGNPTLTRHLASPSEKTWHPLASLLQPDFAVDWYNIDSSDAVEGSRWRYPKLVAAWSVQPSSDKVSNGRDSIEWQRTSSLPSREASVGIC